MRSFGFERDGGSDEVDFFDPLIDADAIDRVSVTESEDPEALRFSWIDPNCPNRLLRGPRG